uniref:Uncharacterized protein n=1 Tax=Vespula pensylvanica TaxID=30213 RepID=A0A834NBY2_VESPE|nr:hypothetical protein H0235_015079 [Vespula pensylvanica]
MPLSRKILRAQLLIAKYTDEGTLDTPLTDATAWLGLAWLGLAWLGLAWLGLGWAGLGWLGLGWVGLG